MDFTELSVLIVHYRTPALLEKALDALLQFVPGAQLRVLECGPAAQTEALLTGRFEQVKFQVVPNAGFAQTVNAGLEHCDTPFIAHMNADVIIGPNTFPRLLDALIPPEIGMAGPRCTTPDGRDQPQGLPYRLYPFLLDGLACPWLVVPWLSGCLQLVKREVLEHVGGMDGSLRFYNEDMEWCMRLRRAGYQCRLVNTEVLHMGGSATPRDPKFLIEGYRGGYLLSQRYASPAYRWAHRRLVRLECILKKRSRDPIVREAYEQIDRMFQANIFTESPFGDTLEMSNPRFFESMP